MAETVSAENIKLQVRSKQISMLFNAMPLAALATVLAAALLLAGQWNVIEHSLLFIWAGCLALITVFRVFMAYLFRKASPRPEAIGSWENWFFWGTVAAGIIWGSSGILLFPADNLPHQVFLAIILIGVTAGAVTTLSFIWKNVFAFILLTLLPLNVSFFLMGTHLELLIWLAILAFITIVSSSSWRIYSSTRQAMWLQEKSHINEQNLITAQRQVIEKNAQLELVIESTDAGIWDWQMHNGELTINKQWASFIGYTLNELTPMTIDNWTRLIHPEDRQRSKELFEQHWHGKTERYNCELRMQHKNGQWLWVLNTGKVVAREETGKPRRMIGIQLDIDERKKSEEAQQKVELRFLELFHSSDDAMLLMDGETYIDANLAAAKMLGYQNQQQILQTHPTKFSPPLQADGQNSADKASEMISIVEKEGVNRFEWLHQKRNGTIFPVEVSLAMTPISIHGKTVIHCIWRDLTEIKQAESELLRAKEDAEAATRTKSEFLASMSHEIRTPMNGVLGMLDLLSATKLDKDQHHQVSLAQSSAKSLLTLINDILDFSKIEAGKLELETLDFNLQTMLGEFVEAMALQVHDKNIEVILDIIQIEPAMVRGDPGRLRQILTNLVGNAIKFTEQGEIIIVAQLSPCSSAANDNGSVNNKLQLHCKVSDTGIGIADDKIAHLFDSFRQVDASTTRKYGGSGLGLTIAKKLCELMDGDIHVTSQAGKGSCFEFNLLLDCSEQSQEFIPEIDISQLQLLLVDDNAVNRNVLTRQLQHWGASVTEAENGQSALALCEQQRQKNTQPFFDIAILDMQMPEMDGLELAKNLKADPRFSQMKLIMMTPINNSGNKKYFSQLGISAYFPKPTTISDLFDALAVAAGQGNAQIKQNNNAASRQQEKKTQGQWPEQSRILLVEDNKVNQLVAKGILKKFGLSADIADNGSAALQQLQQSDDSAPYTMILMDCQMPEMDGYEASRQIRSGTAGKRYEQIPIIAMTANAMLGDREKCLNAGMSDYLSKPVNSDSLYEKLCQWLEL